MRRLFRWTIALTGSAALFAGSWYVCQDLAKLDSATSEIIASAILVLALAVLSWWAAHEDVCSNADMPVPATSVGNNSPAVTGNQGLVIGGDVNNSTIQVAGNRANTAPSAPAPTRKSVPDRIVVGDIPQRPPAFQSRDPLLTRAGEQTGSPDLRVIHAITGMRGVGKTQVAAAYARTCVNDGWRLVAWVNAEDTATTLDGLAQVASALGITAPGDDQPTTARALRRWLEADGRRCLVVFDDAPDPDQLRPYLPVAGDARIIITSTHRSLSSLGTSIPIDVFTKSEALAYLAQRTGSDDTDGAQRLASELGCLPLALAQAAALITRQQISYSTYIDRLRAFPIAQYLTRPSEDPYPRALPAAALLALQAAFGSDTTRRAAPLMSLIALLSPAGVPRTLLHSTVTTGPPEHPTRQSQSALPDAAELDAALAHLADASLITFSLDGSAISTHQLTSRILREQQEHDGTLRVARAAAIALLQAATNSLEPPWQHGQAAKDLVQQITALATHLAPAVSTTHDDMSLALLGLRAWSLSILTELADNPAQAISIGESVTADLEHARGHDDPNTVGARGNLAVAHQLAGHDDEAIPLHKRNLVTQERILGADHPKTLGSLNNLALAYLTAGRTPEAVRLLERSLPAQERMLGNDHPDTLKTRSNLAFAYFTAGRTTLAIRLLERSIADRERVLGNDHPDTLISRNNLANAYKDTGRADRAIPLYERTLVDRERILGNDHPDTLASLGNLAGAYAQIGRVDEAIPLFQRTLAGQERILGNDHPATIRTRTNLVTAYEARDGQTGQPSSGSADH